MITGKKDFVSLFIIVGCVLIDVLIVLLIYPKFSYIGTDGVSYALMGKSIAEGKGLTVFGQPHLYFAPLYSYTIATIYLVVHNIDLAAHLATIIAGLASLPLLYYVLRALSGNNIIAAIGMIFLSANGRWLWTNTITPRTQALAGFLLIVFLLLLFKYLHLQNKKSNSGFFYSLSLGLAVGLMYLNRPEYIFLIFPLLIFIWLASRKELPRKKILLYIVVAFIGFSCLAIPYLLYLHHYTGQWLFSGRLYDEYFIMTGQEMTNMDLANPDVHTRLPQNPTLMLFKVLPAFAKFYLKNLYDMEQFFFSAFGFIGIIFFGLGLRSFILQKKYPELLVLAIASTSLLFFALGHNGQNGYITPFLSLFIIFMAVGCYEIAKELTTVFNFSRTKALVLRTTFVAVGSLYFLFPIAQNYFFQRPDFKPIEYQLLGEWFKDNIPDYGRQIILSRKPEIAFYAGVNWHEIIDANTPEQLLDIIEKNDIKYIALDTRSLQDKIYKFMKKNNYSIISDRLRLIKETNFYDNKIYLYEYEK